jgi:hypothetical protein
MSNDLDTPAAQESLYGIGDEFPEVGLEAWPHRKVSRRILAWMTILAEGLVILALLSREIRPSLRDQNSSVLVNLALGTSPAGSAPSLPLAVLDFHSSAETFKRINFFYNLYVRDDPFRRNGTFLFRVILANGSVVNSSLPVAYVACSGAHNQLPCRVDASYPLFLSDFPECNWLFRGDDDTWINTTVLYRYLNMLNTQFEPREEIVIRAHANNEGRLNWYIHGGCGWLMSRAAVSVHLSLNLSLVRLLPWARYHQQDTAESIIVRKLFGHQSLWDDCGFQGYKCSNCESAEVRARKWDALPKCSDDEVAVHLSDLMALHTVSVTSPVLALIKTISVAPDNVLLSRNVPDQRSYICRRTPTTRVWNTSRRNLAYRRLEDLPRPFINYGNLHDDNRI